jgi:hypothetical protein
VIFTRSFVYFHIPKTGGRWFEKLLVEHAPDDWELDFQPGHWTTTELQEHRPQHFDKPRIAFVRNPWDAYVSLFFNWKEKGEFPELTTTFEHFVKHLIETGHTISTWLKNTMSDGVVLLIGRFEQLREDCRVLLQQFEELPAALDQAFQQDEPVNASRHLPYSMYYDERLRAVVAAADAAFIEKFGYKFEERWL